MNTEDEDEFSDKQRPGSPCLDAPVSINGEKSWFLNQLGGRFVGIYFSDDGSTPDDINEIGSEQIPVETITVTKKGDRIVDTRGLLQQHYDAQAGTYYLIRPDQHVAARWREFNKEKASQALARATGR